MVICLERVADLHVVQLVPLPLTVPCFSKMIKMQINYTFLVPVHPGSPGQRAVKQVSVPRREFGWEEHLRRDVFCVKLTCCLLHD